MDLEKTKEKYELIQAYIEHGREKIPAHLVEYIDQLELIRSFYSKYKTKAFIINHIVKVYGVTRQHAGRLFVDALNFFYSDNQVKKEAWRNVYAEKLEYAAALAWERNEIENYRRCLQTAAEMRGLFREEPPALPDELLDRRVIIIQMDPTKLGIPKVSRSELAGFIDKLDVTAHDKHKLRQDAGIIDVEFMEDGTDKP